MSILNTRQILTNDKSKYSADLGILEVASGVEGRVGQEKEAAGRVRHLWQMAVGRLENTPAFLLRRTKR